MSRIVPRVALIGQAYIQFSSEPFLISKENSQLAFLNYVVDRTPVPLDITDDDVKALEILLKQSKIPDEFYYYWNDAVNTSEYSSKLLAMFSAIETLVKKTAGKKDFSKLEKILGKRLKRKLWSQKNDWLIALRHRLTHGEYFLFTDFKDDYIDLIHKRIIRYFNKNVLKADLI